jgi:photosystem II stability/assembly factor-like uncharacterized protein
MVRLLRRGSSRRSTALAAVLLVVTASLTGCLGWFSQLFTSDGSLLQAIACPSASMCVAVGTTEGDGGNGLIEVTTDDGAHWSSKVVSPLLEDVSCWDVDHCIASGDQLLITDDGGASWTAPSNPPTSFGPVSCSEGDCWTGGPESMVESTDGGNSWGSPETWSAPASISGWGDGTYSFQAATLNSIDCPSTTVCVAVGQATYVWNPPPETTLPQEVEFPGLIVTTGDGGKTWSTQIGPDNSPFAQDGFSAVSCPSSQQCLAVGAIGSYRLTSDDGGATWTGTLLPSNWPYQFTPYGLSCPDAEHCFAVGKTPGGQYASPWPVIKSSDGGNSWTPQAISEPTAVLQSVACVTDFSCWTVGGTSSGSIALHTIDGGNAWPEVSAVSPDSGPVSGGTSVVLDGHFVDVTSVSFGTATTTAFTVDSPTQITLTSPPEAAGSSQTVDVTVNSTLGTSPLTPADQFTYLASP